MAKQKVKRYNLVMQAEMFNDLTAVAERNGCSVVETLREGNRVVYHRVQNGSDQAREFERQAGAVN